MFGREEKEMVLRNKNLTALVKNHNLQQIRQNSAIKKMS